MIDTLYMAMQEQTQQAVHMHNEQKQSIGLIHQKMTNRYKVVEVLPKKADSWDNAFRYADAYGKIRLGYFGGRYDKETSTLQNSFAAAIGGILGIRTAELWGFRLDAAAYISQDLPFLYDTAKRSNDFYTADGSSYAYLAEANIGYSSDLFEAKVGRFAIDMPYANTDDLRMSQNTFEGAWGHLHYTQAWSSQLFYLQRWAGFDSADEENSQNEFKKLVDGGYGMIGASLAYEYNEESEVSLWLHHIDKMADILYGEINGVYDINDVWHLDYGLQAAHLMEQDASDIDGDVYGAMLIGHYENVFAGVASDFARVDNGKRVTDGFGGGPYFTSLDEATIAYASDLVPGENVDTYRFSLGYDKKEWFSAFEYAYGYMSASSDAIKEHDLIYTFDMDEKWQAQAVAASFKEKDNNVRFNRVVVRIEYNF